MSPSDDLTITVSAGTRNPREKPSLIQNVPTAAMHCNSIIALLQSIKLEKNTKVYTNGTSNYDPANKTDMFKLLILGSIPYVFK